MSEMQAAGPPGFAREYWPVLLYASFFCHGAPAHIATDVDEFSNIINNVK